MQQKCAWHPEGKTSRRLSSTRGSPALRRQASSAAASCRCVPAEWPCEFLLWPFEKTQHAKRRSTSVQLYKPTSCIAQMALIASSFAAHHISRTNLATSRGRVAAPMACGRSRWQSLPSTFGILVAWRAHTWYGRGAGGWWVRGGPIFVVGNVERALGNW